MITVIYGSKGTGKTKAIIDRANNAIEGAKGAIVYVTDTKDHMYEIRHEIRYVMTNNSMISGIDSFIGFLSGMLAADHDIEQIYIDGAARIAGVKITELKNLFDFFEKQDEIHFIVTVSSNYDNLPDFIKKHI